MPASDTTVARPSSYEVASTTSMLAGSQLRLERAHAAYGRGARRLGEPAVDDEDPPGEGAGSGSLHHCTSMSIEYRSRRSLGQNHCWLGVAIHTEATRLRARKEAHITPQHGLVQLVARNTLGVFEGGDRLPLAAAR